MCFFQMPKAASAGAAPTKSSAQVQREAEGDRLRPSDQIDFSQLIINGGYGSTSSSSVQTRGVRLGA